MHSRQPPGEPSGEGPPETTSHDQIWKTLIVHFTDDFFQLICPKLAAFIDLGSVEWLDKESFHDFPKGEKVEADLLGQARTRDDQDRILSLHHEFEGTFRSSIDARVDRYIMHLRLKHNRPVLSVVLFLKGGPKGLDIRSVVEHIGPFEVYRSSYCAFGLAGLLAEEWVDRPEPLAAAFAALMRSEVWGPVEKKIRCLRAIARASLDEARRLALADVVETYVELTPEEAKQYAAELTREGNQEICIMEMSWSQRLRAEGRAEGEAKGVRTSIRLLWENKFGALAEAIRQKLEEVADLSRLYEILEQVSEAGSVEEVRL
jgi:hypothetical protein